MGEKCHEETRQYEEQRRQQVERKRKDCNALPWWDPRGWFCSIVTWFEEVWVTVVVTYKETVCVVEDFVEDADGEAALRGAGAGAVIGAIAGGILGFAAGAVAGAIAGAIVGFMLGGIPGAIAGAIIGGLVGGVLGGINGVLGGAMAGAIVGGLVGGFHDAITSTIGRWFGPGPILESIPVRTEVDSEPAKTASARSFILATDLCTVDLRAPYDEEGTQVEYAVIGGRVEWAVGASARAPFQYDLLDLPPFAGASTAGPLAVSYDDTRRGTWGPPPRFDMIAASGDRIIAKAEDTDEIFIAITGHPFVHRLDAASDPFADCFNLRARLLLPQSYFKLDPELGRTSAAVGDLILHILIPNDDERHPATERFPLFRRAYRLGVPKLSEGIQMDMRFVPKVWHKVDARPPRKGAAPPAGYPSYEHVVYARSPQDATRNPRRSIEFHRVLSLGVGHSHLHEQYDDRYGGELDNLAADLGLAKYLGGLVGITTSEDGYRFANGPISDYGGWVDGTCIYYMLVQLESNDQLQERLRTETRLPNAYAILWSDEQFVFTERWRALHIDDNEFSSPFQPIVGAVSLKPGDYYPGMPFDPTRYWCPFRAGHITPTSRMAVARQIVVVNGVDPEPDGDGGAAPLHELYSIHFSWPTMDRTWRRRPFPRDAVCSVWSDASSADPAGVLSTAVVYVDTAMVREDATIVLRGSIPRGRGHLAGRWFQRYLPADGQEHPTAAELASQAPGRKPAAQYTHPWSFVSEDVFRWMQRYSHLGVYEPVRSRVQCYLLMLTDARGLTDEQIGSAVWEDGGHKLQIEHRSMDWNGTARLLRPDLLAPATVSRTHPSIYNDPIGFRVAKRPGVGWILTYFDKRDDKLIGFDGVRDDGRPVRDVVLTDRDDASRTIRVDIMRHLRNARDRHGATVAQELDAISPPQVRRATVTITAGRAGSVAAVDVTFTVARDPRAPNAFDANPAAGFPTWLAMNVWKVKLGALLPEDGTALLLREWVGAEDFVVDLAADPLGTTLTTVRASWRPTVDEQRDGLLARILSPAGRIAFGTSVWFVGATGLACCADETTIVIGTGPG